MSIKRHLEAKIRRTRGGFCASHVLRAIEEMDEAQAQEWWNLLRTIEDDAKREGERRGARQPWKAF